MNKSQGIFTISLDFELYWGVRDKVTVNHKYIDYFTKVHKAIPRLLELFVQNDIHATWAVVGFLFFSNIEDLKKRLPNRLPSYKDKELSPYRYIDHLTSDCDKKLHLADYLIDLISENRNQEIGSHTFSHYYCLEEGQSISEFECDTSMMIETAKQAGITINSMIFPRNQWNEEYLKVIKQYGLVCYRGNEKSWLYRAASDSEHGLIKRMFRLMDAYINISGNNCYDLSELKNEALVNIPSSRFLRSASKKTGVLETLRLNRIKSGMSYAAKNNLIYHLWWHPHNFGVNLNANMKFLEEILKHFHVLKKRYAMCSFNMGEIANLCCDTKGR